ncbi:L-histidine N(alpha)-methyltransferase [Marinicrinis sediminis]|uniref:L-histidine N(Alpha)-methyltransferase n=1 Tax=Marinicrinis sediminis TaxID=1652465 RepID=A0ABW5REX8_9BACL
MLEATLRTASLPTADLQTAALQMPQRTSARRLPLQTRSFYQDVVSGLSQEQKKLHPKYFYDEEGSKLFEEITTVSEYYVTRTEMAILQSCIADLCAQIGAGASLIEFGSGSSRKIKLLLNELEALSCYMPIDIAQEMLSEACASLSEAYPELPIIPVCADFTRSLQLPAIPGNQKKVIFYPGSTIGNFEPMEAMLLMKQTRQLLEPGDGFIIGVDLKKDVQVLHEAYNDRQGVTARFNLNVLRRMNRELHADFQLEEFEHFAYYNAREGRIEMHIRSAIDQQVRIGDHVFDFHAGETIHTESSYKYDIDQFQQLASQCGYASKQVWTDPRQWFSVHYFEAI